MLADTTEMNLTLYDWETHNETEIFIIYQEK